MGRVLIALLALLSLILPAPPAVAQVEDDRLVLPGERIGHLRLASRLGDLEARYGTGTPQGRGLWDGSTYYDFPAAALSVIADNATGNLLWMSVCACGTNPWRDHATAEGVKLGTSEDQVTAAMGTPARTFSDAQGTSLYYPEKGITFTLTATAESAGRVASYRIFWPNRSPGDTVIVPGQRISGVRVGTAGQAAVAALGGGFISVRQGPVDLYHWPHFALVIFVEGGRVVQVSVAYDPLHEAIGLRYATGQGIGIGTTRAQLRAAFGEPAQRDVRGPAEVWVYPSQGIAFYVAVSGPQAGQIVGAGVFAPR